jgi:methionyl-tRNA formyltransferase
MRFLNIAIAGNEFGVKQTYRIFPKEVVKCIIAPSIRPHLFEPIRIFSESHNTDFLIQPKFGSEEYVQFVDKILALKIDLLITNNYSMIIRPDLLKLLGGNAINVHWAMLPMNRGCNPVNWPVIKGESKSGITLHYMDDGLDSGDIIAQREVPIFFEDTWVSLKNRLAFESESFLQEALGSFIRDKSSRIKQDETLATFNNRLYPHSPRINFIQMSDLDIYNLIRGQVAPLQGAFVEKSGRKIYFNEFVPFERIKDLREKYS